MEIGLIKPETYHLSIDKGNNKQVNYFNDKYQFSVASDSGIGGIEVFYLTKIGSELAPISGAEEDDKYILSVKESLQKLK